MLQFAKRPGKISRSYINEILSECFKHLASEISPQLSEVSVVFTSDKEIHALNLEYRKKDKATDVLSFPQFSKNELNSKKSLFGHSLGDIVISVDTLKKQAKEFEVSEKEEVARLLIHGFLHLLGYDHEKVSQNEANRMRRKERKLTRIIQQTSLA